MTELYSKQSYQHLDLVILALDCYLVVVLTYELQKINYTTVNIYRCLLEPILPLSEAKVITLAFRSQSNLLYDKF